MPKVQVKVKGVWRDATAHQAAAFAKRKRGEAVKTGKWTVFGSPGYWEIHSITKSYRIRNYRPRQPRFADLAAQQSEAWTQDRAARFFDRFVQKLPSVNVRPYRAAVIAFVTGAADADFGRVAIFGEIAFGDMGLTSTGFWVGSTRFANSDGKNYQTHRNLAMALFNEAEQALK